VCLATTPAVEEVEESVEAHQTVEFSESDTSRTIEVHAIAPGEPSIELRAAQPIRLRSEAASPDNTYSNSIFMYCAQSEICKRRLVVERNGQVGAFSVELTGTLKGLFNKYAEPTEDSPLVLELHIDVVE
jgi:hypothetical protein